jgi:hypothetical protein
MASGESLFDQALNSPAGKAKSAPKSKGKSKSSRATSKEQRSERSRRDELQVQRMLETHFPDLSVLEFDHSFHNGLSLRQRVEHERALAQRAGKHVAPCVWSTIKEDYNVNTSADELAVRDATQVCHPEYIEASLSHLLLTTQYGNTCVDLRVLTPPCSPPSSEFRSVCGHKQRSSLACSRQVLP